MPFCTMLEWDKDFDLASYSALNKKAGVHDHLPDGCLSRIVGPIDGGARIIEVWRSGDDAARFNNTHGHLVAEFHIPPPIACRCLRDLRVPGSQRKRLKTLSTLIEPSGKRRSRSNTPAVLDGYSGYRL